MQLVISLALWIVSFSKKLMENLNSENQPPSIGGFPV